MRLTAALVLASVLGPTLATAAPRYLAPQAEKAAKASIRQLAGASARRESFMKQAEQAPTNRTTVVLKAPSYGWKITFGPGFGRRVSFRAQGTRTKELFPPTYHGSVEPSGKVFDFSRTWE